MQKVNSLLEVSKNDILLIIRNNGDIMGMDTVQSIDVSTGKYSYLNIENKMYEGNLSSFMKSASVFKANKDIFNYTDKHLSNVILGLEWVFEMLYGDFVGQAVQSEIREKVKDFSKRVELINFYNKNEEIIHKVRWGVDEELKYTAQDFTDSCSVLLDEMKTLFV